MGVGRRPREEIVKWNQMAALRFQTGARHLTSPASLRVEEEEKAEEEEEKEKGEEEGGKKARKNKKSLETGVLRTELSKYVKATHQLPAQQRCTRRWSSSETRYKVCIGFNLTVQIKTTQKVKQNDF